MKQLNVKLISILLAIIFLIISCSSIFNIYTNSNQVNRYSAYADSIALTSTDKIETISYSTKETSTMETVNGVPSYRQISGLSNACGATSGAIVVGFYDKYYEDLIPIITQSFFSAVRLMLSKSQMVINQTSIKCTL